ncbi:MAG: ATP-binding protein [Chloroflexi bacterium]|nr:ATP-binding protein [Chloroflexota bacterium]
MRELSLHILDILQNSLEAGAQHLVLEINESSGANRLIIRVQDDGRGMDRQTLERVTDPFFTTRKTRQVGLGITLLKAAAERCNGALEIASKPGSGTTVTAAFQLDHIDRAPLGDIKSTILSVILANQQADLHYVHQVNGRRFEMDTAEIRSELGGVPLTEPRVRRWLEDYLQQGYNALYAVEDDKEPLTGD